MDNLFNKIELSPVLHGQNVEQQSFGTYPAFVRLWEPCYSKQNILVQYSTSLPCVLVFNYHIKLIEDNDASEHFVKLYLKTRSAAWES